MGPQPDHRELPGTGVHNAITEKGSVPVESDSDPSRLIIGLGLGLVVILAALAALTFGRTRPPTSD